MSVLAGVYGESLIRGCIVSMAAERIFTKLCDGHAPACHSNGRDCRNSELPLRVRSCRTLLMSSREKLTEFAAWCQNHIPDDEKDQAQSFTDSEPLEFSPELLNS